MENQDTRAQERLRALWGAWGLEPDPTLGDKQVAALGALGAWLDGATSRRIVEATQFLMLSPESPAAHRTGPAKTVAQVVSHAWSTVGTQASHVQFCQAMLLACWPVAADGSPWDVARLMDPMWAAIKKPEVIAADVKSWRESTDDYRSVKQLPEGVTSRRLGAKLKAPQDDPAAIKALAALPPNASMAALLPALSHVLTTFQSHISYLTQRDKRREAGTVTPPELDLMWWGQAKYCQRLGEPYRRLTSPGRLTLHLAADVAERMASRGLPFAPTAAYLAEVAADLGLAWDEERTLGAWLSEIVDPLRSEPQLIGVPAAELAGFGAIGLPVLWLAGDGGARVDDVPERCGVSTETQLDRAEWLRWLLGEMTLARVAAS